MTTVSWFSAGASSALATRLLINEIDHIIYTHIDDQHPDTIRFVCDCEKWFGKPVTIIQSRIANVENAVRMAGGKGYINGRGGAACTHRLKRRVRMEWERKHKDLAPFRYVWGLDADESNRAERIVESMPDQEHVFPLIDNNIGKEEVHQTLFASGIKRPMMYELGYNNNNCVGCVKGGMGYWNHIRKDFPDVFEARAKLERVVGASCINGVYLDELDPERGRHSPPVVDDCGIFCELMAIEDADAEG